jgi:hypothetical protein
MAAVAGLGLKVASARSELRVVPVRLDLDSVAGRHSAAAAALTHADVAGGGVATFASHC